MKKILLSIFLLFFSIFIYAQEKSIYQLPKKSGFITPSFSLKQSNSTNVKVFGVQIDNENKLDYSINFNWGYFLNDNFSIGIQVSYNNKREDLTYYPNGLFTVSNSYSNFVSLTPNIRNYFGPGMFKGFAQTNVGFSFGKGLTRIYTDANDSKIESDLYQVTIAVQPGIALFVADFVTLEVSVNILGLTSKYEKSIVNNTSESITTSNTVSFDVSILTLNIGIGFYFNTKKYSKPPSGN
jgi:hypothetical protein